ncbi:MAG TPA: formylglycine-generating enzyme family protein [Myxococcota bacterium]|nr:formylglycine-generating enzyme family protein [Myxococcota bacterium]
MGHSGLLVRCFMLVSGLTILVLLVLAPSVASAQVPDQAPPPVLAVMDITFDRVEMRPDAQSRMNDYLVSCMSGNGAFMVVARDDVARALSEQRVKFSSECYGSCRAKIGGYLAANSVLQAKMWKVGSTCVLTADLYDLASDTNVASHSVKDLNCDEVGLMKGIETISARFGAGISPSAPVITGGKTVSPGSNGGFQVTDLPAVPEVRAVRDINAEGGMGGIDNVDLDALEAYDKVVAIDGDRSTPTADKIRAWEDLGRRFPSYADKAASRVAEWRQYEVQRAEAERVERLRREAMESDWGKLSRLLKLKVVSDAQKKEWATAFINAYGSDSAKNPHFGDLMQYTVSIPAGWVVIPAGSFLMGSPPTESGRSGDEGPQTRVTIGAPFMLKKTEVTQGEWKAVMGSNPSGFGSCGDTCPVETVSWNDAVEYCNRLSKKENLEQCYDKSGDSYTFRGVACRGYRLPTEAEWEYAARAGSTAARHGEIDQVAWSNNNSGSKTHPVGQKQANAWGLWDMLGNVWEWCSDWYAGNLVGGSVTDPMGPSSGSTRVFRGGSWNTVASNVRAAFRYSYSPGNRHTNRGFRPARSVR